MEKTIRMPKALLKKWLAALRSGKYKQGKEYLCNDGAYCCLGVLQHEAEGRVTPDGDTQLPSVYWLEGHGISFKSRAGTTTDAPHLPSLDARADAANDKGRSFAEIADAIEACAEGY